jgi:L,D-transpeptidase YcbB
MEQWRWMPSDLGQLYVWNNIPEYIQRVVDKGEIVNTERIVAGEIGKQTPIFSRSMRKIVFRPKWKVPESIKVREIWPSLLRGGGLLAQYGLEIETKDGKRVDPRAVNWAKEDIRNYEVIQPPGPKSVLGVVKFTFPNPHTVYMHDTQDKHLFAASQRTYSHGCMRVKNPLRLAELLLGSDQGLDAAAIADFVKVGPLDNEVALQRKIPVHTTYFTALVSDDGKVTTFRDVYGHEKRIVQALEGRWTEIAKGRDHLAPVEPDMAAAVRPRPVAQRTQGQKPFDFLSAVFSGGF